MTGSLQIYIQYVCYKCPSSNKEYNKPFNLRRHLKSRIHSIKLPSRQTARGEYFCADSGEIPTVVDKGTDGALPYYGCPCCWTVHPKCDWMIEHIVNTHEPLVNDDIAISTKKEVFRFRRSIASSQPKRPKITDKTIDTLSPVVSFVSNHYLTDQVNLVELKKYTTAHKLLVQAMDVPLSTLPHFLWIFQIEDNTNSDDLTFVNIIRCILTDFYSKCQRSPHFQPKYERTFWVDRVVPIFQALGDHSQLLGFQWCEVPTEEHTEFTIDPTTWKRSVPIKFHDELGYDMNNCNKLVMEGSSRYIDRENIQHSQDDSIKILHTSIELLDSLIQRHFSASFSSLCLIKSFSVQCVCTTITLSTTSLDPKDAGAYTHAHVRSATIPVNYDSRASWTAVFELLAYLFTCLKEQKLVLETVTKESTGFLPVADDDRGMKILRRIHGSE